MLVAEKRHGIVRMVPMALSIRRNLLQVRRSQQLPPVCMSSWPVLNRSQIISSFPLGIPSPSGSSLVLYTSKMCRLDEMAIPTRSAYQTCTLLCPILHPLFIHVSCPPMLNCGASLSHLMLHTLPIPYSPSAIPLAHPVQHSYQYNSASWHVSASFRRQTRPFLPPVVRSLGTACPTHHLRNDVAYGNRNEERMGQKWLLVTTCIDNGLEEPDASNKR